MEKELGKVLRKEPVRERVRPPQAPVQKNLSALRELFKDELYGVNLRLYFMCVFCVPKFYLPLHSTLQKWREGGLCIYMYIHTYVHTCGLWDCLNIPFTISVLSGVQQFLYLPPLGATTVKFF